MLCLNFHLVNFRILNLNILINFVKYLQQMKQHHSLISQLNQTIHFLLLPSYRHITDTFLLIEANHRHHLHFHRLFYYLNHLHLVHPYPSFLPRRIHHFLLIHLLHFHQSLLIHNPLHQYLITLSDCLNCIYYIDSINFDYHLQI